MAVAVIVIGVVVVASQDDSDDEQASVATGGYEPDIDPASFTTTIDNPYLPFERGNRWRYEGVDDEGEKETIVVEVTRETKVVMGVRCVVVRDTVRVGDELVEDTYDWYAQDADGNVWYFGEDTKEYEDGEVASTEGSWQAGVDGAQPGIVMLADPKVGDEYQQEFLEGEAEDRGEVLRFLERLEVAAGAFTDIVVTKDFTPLEPDVVEHKYFARGIGLVREETVEGGSDRADLVEVNR